MVAMTNTDLWHEQDRLLTVDDLDEIAEDGPRYELDDGVLIVSPAPPTPHQLTVTRLTTILVNACPDEFVVLAGVGLNITKFQHRYPDVAVISADAVDVKYQEHPPALAVEVASKSTRLYDQNRKKEVYESFGIPSYWIVMPDRDRPRLIVFELRDGRYEQVADVSRDEQFHATWPFPVAVRPSALVRTGPLD